MHVHENDVTIETKLETNMKRKSGWLVAVCCSLALSLEAKSESGSKNWPAAADIACKAWTDERFSGENGFPFSFRYGGRPSDELLGTWKQKVSTRRLDGGRIGEVRRYTDPESGLEVRCEIVRYTDYPAVEWVVWLRNGGRTETEILSDIRTLDAPVGVDGSDRIYINYHIGGSSGAQGIQGIQEFQPYRVRLAKRDSIVKGAFWAGFPTALNLPFFNAEWITDSGAQGMIAAVGWPARWKASFDRSLDSALTVRVGQIHTRLRLQPGEEIRTPLVALMFWQGDREEAQNMFRGWMYDHNLPRPGGKLPEPILEAASSSFFAEMFRATDRDQMEFIDRYLEEDVRLDYWWMDAGWYPNKGGTWQDLLGSWWPDPKRYPEGLRAISDHAHAKGVKTLLWFEPERVTRDSWLWEHRPEWLARVTGSEGHPGFFNYGIPEARQWMVDHVDSLLTSEDIDLYRQDFAVMSGDYWDDYDRLHPDRQGMAEILHVMGYLDYMDRLQERHPDMLFDICAAGGKRLELENLRRAVPLWRSDYAFEPLGVQGQTYGISSWIPFSGAGVNRITTYDFRSNMSPSIVLNLDARIEDADYPLLRRLLAQWREIQDDYRGNYYALTPYSLQNDVWIGWMFYRPEAGTGFVQMFNRPGSIYESGTCRLKGLEPDDRYRVTDMDTGEAREATGREWMENGLKLVFTEAPDARLYRIERR